MSTPLLGTDIPDFLVSRGLLDKSTVVDGEVVIEDLKRRNSNFSVICKPGRSLFVKQGLGASGAATVRREAAVYGLLEGLPSRYGARNMAPRCVHFDTDRAILVLELQGIDVRRHQGTRARYSVTRARRMGKLLGRLHSFPVTQTQVLDAGRASRPWWAALSAPPVTLIDELSSASIQLVRVVQQHSDLTEGLSELHAEPREHSLLHGDVKWDNWLVLPSGGLRLIDWEAAAQGDPCSDIGSVFASYLSTCIRSIPQREPCSTGGPHATPPLPIGFVQPAIRAFWRSYALQRSLSPSSMVTVLSRSVRYTAVRLIHVALEGLQPSASMTRDAVYMLQMAANILNRPDAARLHLLSISLREDLA